MKELIIINIKNKLEFKEFIPLYKKAQKSKPTLKILRQLEKDFFSKNPPFNIFLAYMNKKPIGFMITIPSYSSSFAKKTLYLEEFYIEKEFRNKGFGGKLFQYLISYAKQNKFLRLEWCTEEDNKKAIRFYERYANKDKWRYFKLEVKKK